MILLILLVLLLLCAATIILESFPCLFRSRKGAWWKAGVLCNIVTNPVLNTFVMLLMAMSFPTEVILGAIFAAEIAVVFTEAHFYRHMMQKNYWNCFVFSLICNGLSFGVGLLCKDIFLTFLQY